MRKDIENQNNHESIVTRSVPPEILKELGLDDIELPEGYCIIGGAARSVAFAVLHSDMAPPPIRDLDLGYIIDQDPDLSRYDELSAKFMPDDYEHGNGAQGIDEVEDYMNSRDFTMNQVILQGNRLTITKRAVDDIKRGVIRVASYGEAWYPESDLDRKHVSDRLAIKAQLMSVVMHDSGHDVVVDPEMVNRQSSDYFSLALFLQKAFEYGDGVPEKFLDNLRKVGLFDDEVIGGAVLDVMRRIDGELLERPFEWRNKALWPRWLATANDSLLNVSDEVWDEEMERISAMTRGLKGASRKILNDEMAKIR